MNFIDSIRHEIYANCTVDEINLLTELQTKIFNLVEQNGIIGIYALAIVSTSLSESVGAIMQCERKMKNG